MFLSNESPARGAFSQWLYQITKRFKYVLFVMRNNMITKQQILVFKTSADTLYQSKDYTSATILYFKTLFAIQDFVLLEATGESPKDHKSRFRQLEKHFPQMYEEIDLEFSTYRDTYSKIIDLETCQRIKNLIEKNVNKHQIKE